MAYGVHGEVAESLPVGLTIKNCEEQLFTTFHNTTMIMLESKMLHFLL